MGIAICADGSDFTNLKRLTDAGARIIYGPHANSNKGTTQSWYAFREKWGGAGDGNTVMLPTSNDGPAAAMPSGGWMKQLKVYGALVNLAARYGPEFNPSAPNDTPQRWSGGAWFIGPDGKTLAQMPVSNESKDSREFVLIYNVPTE